MSVSYTPDGDREWGILRRVYNALLQGLKVAIYGFDGAAWRAVKTDADGVVQVSGTVSGGGGTQMDDGDAVDTNTQGNLVVGATAVPGTARALRCTDGGTLLVDGSAVTQPVSATNLDIRDLSSVSDSVAVTDGGGSLTVDGAVTVSGTVSVTEPVSVDDNGGSLTVDGTVAVSSVAGTVVVGDGGGSLTVDGAVTVSGTVSVTEPVSVDDNGGSLTVDGSVTADTELTTKDYDTGVGTDTQAVVGILLPASGGAVAGGTSTNPIRTDPTGTTNQPVVGAAATDAAVAGNPVYVAGRADDTEAGAVSADGDVVPPWLDRKGRIMAYSGWPTDLLQKVVTVSDGDAATELVAAVAATKIVVFAIEASTNNTALRRLDIKEGTTAKHSMYCAVDGGGYCKEWKDGFPLATNTALNAQLDADAATGKDFRVNVTYRLVPN